MVCKFTNNNVKIFGRLFTRFLFKMVCRLGRYVGSLSSLRNKGYILMLIIEGNMADGFFLKNVFEKFNL